VRAAFARVALAFVALAPELRGVDAFAEVGLRAPLAAVLRAPLADVLLAVGILVGLLFFLVNARSGFMLALFGGLSLTLAANTCL